MRPSRPSPSVPLLILALVLTTSGCASRRGSLREAAAPLPPGFTQLGPHVSNWKGKVRVGDESSRFRLGLLLAPPDHFVVELKTPVGALVLRAGHDGERVRIVIPRERVYLDEPGSAATVERLLGLPLEPEDLVAVMVGRPGAPAFPDGEAAAPSARLREASLRGSAGVVEARFGTDVPAASGVLPEVIDLAFSGGPRPVEIHLALREAHEVGRRPAATFRLAVPEGFRRVRLRDLADEGPLLLPPVEDPS